MQPCVQEAYKENDIGATKGNPSGTSKNQVLDVSPIFMCVHKAVEQANSKQKKVKNVILRRSLAKFVREVAIEFPCTKNTLSSVYVEKTCFGAETLLFGLQNGAVISEKLIKAFDTTGKHIQDPIGVPESFGFPNNKSTVDYRRIIGLYTTKLSDESLSNFESAVPTLLVEYRAVGRNLSSFMDA